MKSMKYIAAIATALTLAACSTEEEMSGTGTDAVKLSVSVGESGMHTSSTPIGTSTQQTSFSDGDKISISDGSQTAVYTFSGNEWSTADTPLAWQPSSGTFQAFYPADGTNTFTNGVLKTDQSSLDNLAASDYMRQTYTYTSIPADLTLSLELQRQTARVIFKIASYESQFDGKSPVIDYIHVFSPTEIPASTGSTFQEITTYYNNGEYVALVSPTAAKYVQKFVKLQVKTSDGATTVLYVEDVPAMEAGKSYTYNLVVGKDKVSVASVSVKDWGTGSAISEGKARELVDYVKTSIAEQLAAGTDVVLTLPATVDDDVFTAIKDALKTAADGSINLTLNGIETVNTKALQDNLSLKSITLPVAKTIGYNVFERAKNLETVNIPKVEYIGYLAFASIESLKSITLPAVKEIGGCAFAYDYLLETVYAPNCSVLCGNAFDSDNSLKKITLGALEKVEYYFLDNVDTKNIDLYLSEAQYWLWDPNGIWEVDYNGDSGVKDENGDAVLYYKDSSDYTNKKFLGYTFKSVTLY